MVVICDISAWQYWRTPPVVREGWLDAALLDQMLSAASSDREILKPLRANAREAERLIRWRLLADLKGLSLPVHVMVDVRESRHASEILRVHEYPRNLPADMLVDLGNGLYVMPPELSASLSMRKTDVVTMAKRMFEACGLFSIIPSNPRIQLVLNDLLSGGVLAASSSRGDGIYGYSDSNGRRQGFLDQEGEALPWSPTFDRTARLTDMWKRAPLTSTDAITAIPIWRSITSRWPILKSSMLCCPRWHAPWDTRSSLERARFCSAATSFIVRCLGFPSTPNRAQKTCARHPAPACMLLDGDKR